MLDFDSESATPRQFALDYPIVAAMKIILQLVQPAPVAPVIKHTFLKDIELGDRNPEVVFLQDRLKQLGYFPLNVDSTGFYGNITKTAVAAFQKANGIRPSKPGVYCYILTRTALNK
jgi:peptidoglycan hydrolase-like protein with peptidoglycan-binding domain